MAKTNKLKKLNQLDGKHDKATKTKPQTIDELLGITSTGKYTTTNEKEYSDYLNDLNKSDLQRHAVNIGLAPVDDRVKLTNRLIAQFKKDIARFTPVSSQSKRKEVSPEVKRILSEGF